MGIYQVMVATENLEGSGTNADVSITFKFTMVPAPVLSTWIILTTTILSMGTWTHFMFLVLYPARSNP